MSKKQKRGGKQKDGNLDVETKFGDIQGPDIDATGAEINSLCAGNQRIKTEFRTITADKTAVLKGTVISDRTEKKS